MKKILLIAILFSSSFVFSAIAKDNRPPTIELLNGKKQNLQVGGAFILNEPKAVSDNLTDSAQIIVRRQWNYTGPINLSIRKQYALFIEAEDLDGNIAYDTIVFIVDDFIPPSIDLNTPTRVCTEYRQPYNRVQATATDNYYNNSSLTLSLVSSNVNTNLIGLYQDVYEAVDASGNRTQAVRIVEVKINCNNSSVLNIPSVLNFDIYPMPCSEFLTIKSELDLSEAFVSIYNLDGRLLLKQNYSQEILTAGIPNGLFLLVIESNQVVYQTHLQIIH